LVKAKKNLDESEFWSLGQIDFFFGRLRIFQFEKFGDFLENFFNPRSPGRWINIGR